MLKAAAAAAAAVAGYCSVCSNKGNQHKQRVSGKDPGRGLWACQGRDGSFDLPQNVGAEMSEMNV
jgi:hypothetical protein